MTVKNAITRPARVVFMGTPEFAVPTLEALLRDHEVVAVYTQPDRPAGRGRRMQESVVKGLARSAGVPVEQPRSLRRDASAAAGVSAYEPDVVVVAAYGLILPAAVLSAGPFGALNVHASVLPRWRGAAPVQRAILAGDTETGVSIMRMDEGLDTGDVLAAQRTAIGERETGTDLTARLARMGAEVLSETLAEWLAGRVAPVAQDDGLATLAPKIEPDERRLDLARGASELVLRVRALADEPGARIETADGPLKVLAARAERGGGLGPGGRLRPGEAAVIGGWPWVGTGDGALVLERVQPAGGKAMTGAAFANGRPGFASSLRTEEGVRA